ncbi:3'-5' exonuclease [Herminiimonas sp. CN]|uniref:3'-5' exonuclease n=1 Tax=Herminiimonas sp. CN TaxID=1349818 RepID=UPI000474168A|nr:3'-5' exonuclease [Herminiimonas sp. CN]
MSKAVKYPAIMFDLETLGTRADAVILSIGAVKFNPDTGKIGDDAFYASVSIDSNTEAGRHISEDALLWWFKQSAEAQQVFREPKVVLGVALDDLAAWIDHEDYQVWSNGADFDIPMLAHAYSTHGLIVPWKFYNTNCYRTFKKLPFAKNAAKLTNALKHNALTDAIHQAQQLHEYYKTMKEAA